MQALAVIILVLQVAGSGGPYPVEVLPGIFKVLYPFMPFRYAMDAMRECIGGMYGNTYWECLGVLMLFMFLISAYSLGMELKFNRGKEWIEKAQGNIVVAIVGKYLPHVLIFLSLMCFYQFYIYHVLHFPHAGGWGMVIVLTVLSVFGSIGFGIFAFGLMPSLRMSMSICSLWGVLSFSLAGSAFPAMGMDAALQALTWLFPLRHYYMLFQITVFNGYPLIDAWFHLVALIAFTLMPWFVIGKIKNAMLTYVYIP